MRDFVNLGVWYIILYMDRSRKPVFILIIVVFVLVVAGFLSRNELGNIFNSNNANGGMLSGYQAVFLTNGQVYFGKLENANSKHPVLTEVYYLQSSQQNPQSTTDQSNQQQTKLSLVKLGNELHGPTDKMVLKGDQILFWEDLKDDGQVVKLIKENQAKK